MYCRKCGKEIDDEAAFCVHCGVATKEQPVYQQPVINVVNTNTNTNTNINNNTTGYIHKKKSTGKVDMVFAILNALYLLQQDIIFEDGFIVQTF